MGPFRGPLFLFTFFDFILFHASAFGGLFLGTHYALPTIVRPQ